MDTAIQLCGCAVVSLQRKKNKYFRFPINLNDMMDTTFRERTMKEIKQTQLQIRITNHEKSKLKTIADNSNLSMSDYIRSLINKKRIIETPSEFERQRIYYLSKFTNILNEFIVLARSDTLPESEDLKLFLQGLQTFIEFQEKQK
ncbi:plasmid mobilization protein [Endozoicomonas ascidiicola]|uniref:plasmid mobilization protein n=1 Tax=Endozoicomonas ascidiicola TaxID=1698521 RepID=UPI000830FF29|nr:hypothetical protein [Endozoicomonas ascidiicola]